MAEILVRYGLPEVGNDLTRQVGSIGCAICGVAEFAFGRALPLALADLVTLPWLS